MWTLPVLDPDHLTRYLYPEAALKPQTLERCQTARWRPRAMLTLPEEVRLYPYAYQEHGTDVLLIWYYQVWQAQEHRWLWGDVLGTSPSRFVAEAIDWELVFLVDEAQGDWTQGKGILGAAWGDDRLEPVRQRLHFWAAPAVRRARCTDALAAQMLDYFFARYRVLWGMTPVTRPHVVRTWKRWGFQAQGVLPLGAGWDDPVDAVISAQTRAAWVRRYQENHP